MLATWVLTTIYGFGVAYLSTTDDIAVTLEPKAADDGKYIPFFPSPVVDRQGNDCFTKALSQLWCQEQTPVLKRGQSPTGLGLILHHKREQEERTLTI